MNVSPDELRDLYLGQHLTTRAIAERCEVSHMSVKRWLRACDIPRRTPGRGLAHRELLEPTRDELVDLVHRQHKSYREIAALYDVDFTAIPHWLKKHGIPRPTAWTTRRQGILPELPDAATLRDLYDAGWSLTAIGAKCGVSAGPIRALCTEYGIPVRRDGFDGGKRLTCSDGHTVRSTYEHQVDEWLSQRGVVHTYEPQLPFDRRWRADFLANGWYIEVWGMLASPKYRSHTAQKRAAYQRHGLPLIEIAASHFKTRDRGILERRLRQCLNPASGSSVPHTSGLLPLPLDEQ